MARFKQIQKMTVHEFFCSPNSKYLLNEYAGECAIAGMPTPKPDMALYTQMERHGAFHVLGALNNEYQLIGFASLLISPNPHYSAIIATVESIFVAQEHRASGAGIALIREAKQVSIDAGATGLFSSAPTGGSLDKVYAKMDCHCTNKVYFWGLQ